MEELIESFPRLKYMLAYSKSTSISGITRSAKDTLIELGLLDEGTVLRNDRTAAFLVTHEEQYQGRFTAKGIEAARVARKLIRK